MTADTEPAADDRPPTALVPPTEGAPRSHRRRRVLLRAHPARNPPDPVQHRRTTQWRCHNWDWDFALSLVPDMLNGLSVTAMATVLGFTLALVVGLVLALGRRSRLRVVRWPTATLIEFIRSTPLLVQLFFLFFALPDLGLSASPNTTLIFGLGIHYGTYCSEAYRAGINSVPAGQWEAATALNLGPVDQMAAGRAATGRPQRAPGTRQLPRRRVQGRPTGLRHPGHRPAVLRHRPSPGVSSARSRPTCSSASGSCSSASQPHGWSAVWRGASRMNASDPTQHLDRRCGIGPHDQGVEGLRRQRGPRRSRPRRRTRRAGRHHRAVRLRQDDDPPGDHDARTHRLGHDRDRWGAPLSRGRWHQAGQREAHPPGAVERRDGLPALQPVPPHDRTREHHPRSHTRARSFA